MFPMTLPQTTQIFTLCITFYIFVVGECRNLTFHTQVDYSTSQPTNGKPFLKGACLHNVTHLEFLDYICFSGMDVVKFVHM